LHQILFKIFQVAKLATTVLIFTRAANLHILLGNFQALHRRPHAVDTESPYLFLTGKLSFQKASHFDFRLDDHLSWRVEPDLKLYFPQFRLVLRTGFRLYLNLLA